MDEGSRLVQVWVAIGSLRSVWSQIDDRSAILGSQIWTWKPLVVHPDQRGAIGKRWLLETI